MYSAEELYSRQEYERMVKAIRAEEDFALIKQEKHFTVTIKNSTVDNETAENIWHGNHYLVHFDEWHNTKHNTGGIGFARDVLPEFSDYETFCDFLNRRVCNNIPGYKPAEEFQLSWF